MLFSPKRLLLLSLLAIGLASGVALGQAATGQITGTIEDAAGAVVPGATVTIANLSTGAQREATTGEAGDFAFLSLPPGKYKVEVAAKGFKRVVVEELDVNITQTSTVNLKLEPSIQEETVTVTAEVNTEGWPAIVGDVLTKANLTKTDVALFLFTQVNLSTIKEVMQKMELPWERTHTIMGKWGYTGSACIPMVLDDAVREGKLKGGDVVVMCASGGGLNMACAAFRW